MNYSLSPVENEVPLLLKSGDGMEQWEKNRNRIQEKWDQWIGGLPASVPTRYTILSETKEKDHIRIHLKYDVAFDDQVTAYLLIPGQKAQPEERFPAMLALHPTNASGKDDIAVSSGRANRKYGLELVQRGYVVLVPDTITAGERIYPGHEAFITAPFYEQHPEWTAVGKMMHDHIQGIDVLTSLSFVDGSKIGAIGHSLGGYNAFFAAGADRRIKAVVSSCGFSTFTGDPEPNRWGQREWFSHIPRLSECIEKGEIPFEFHEIAALCAPTPFFNWSGQNDRIFPNWQAIGVAMKQVNELYQLHGHEDRFISLIGNAEHDFPNYIRHTAYGFLDEQLK